MSYIPFTEKNSEEKIWNLLEFRSDPEWNSDPDPEPHPDPHQIHQNKADPKH